jgi:hypothetical protein
VLEQWLATTLPGVEELRIDDLSKPATSGVANETLLRRALVRPRGHGVGAHQVDGRPTAPRGASPASASLPGSSSASDGGGETWQSVVINGRTGTRRTM